MMPGHDGFEICRRIKGDPATHDVRVIAMTGYPTSDNKQRILMAGAEACLAKPVSNRTLFDALGLHFDSPSSSTEPGDAEVPAFTEYREIRK